MLCGIARPYGAPHKKVRVANPFCCSKTQTLFGGWRQGSEGQLSGQSLPGSWGGDRVFASLIGKYFKVGMI